MKINVIVSLQNVIFISPFPIPVSLDTTFNYSKVFFFHFPIAQPFRRGTLYSTVLSSLQVWSFPLSWISLDFQPESIHFL